MITIKKEVADQIIQHAIKELPNEACGYLAGIGGVITQSFPLTNADHSPDHFSFLPAEQFATVKQARKEGLELLANYHSHPATPARPSQEDIRLAFDSTILYFIVSLAESQAYFKAFSIVDGKVENQEIVIL